MPNLSLDDLEKHLNSLVKLNSDQANAINALGEQVLALFIVNTSIIGVLKNQIDFDVVREAALSIMHKSDVNSSAAQYVSAMLGGMEVKEIPSILKATREQSRDNARSTLRVIDGGNPGPGNDKRA